MKLALGTVQFGMHYGVANSAGRVSQAEAHAILQQASLLGINMLDTAIAYGDSEEVLGKFAQTGQNIVTKLSAVPETERDVKNWVIGQFEGSLERLSASKVYGFLLHRPDQLLGPNGAAIYNALTELKARGGVVKVGVSVYSPDELGPLLERFDLDLVQAPFNILDRRILETGWAERLKENGIELHTRSAFLQGLLLMSKVQRPAKFDRWTSIWDEWGRWLADTGLTPLQACLQFAVQQSWVDRVIVGVDSTQQLLEIVGAMNGKIEQLPNFEELGDTGLVNPAAWNQL
jgi:aryl-alcohol dehydrogenase-like predicted oxidoreductase